MVEFSPMLLVCYVISVTSSVAWIVHLPFALIDGLLLGHHSGLALAAGLTLAAAHARLCASHAGFRL